MTEKDIAIQCIKDEAQAVLDLSAKIDDNFTKAVDMMMHCSGKVIVTGVGKSGHIGAKIAATLASTGTPSFFINPLDVFHGDLGVMAKGDVVLAISNSGQTDELLRFIPMVLHMGIPIIAMSGNPQSLLAKYSNCHLNVSVEKEACPLNLAPTSSTTATLVMGDALAIALMNKRHFQPQDFAQFHWRRTGKATADHCAGRDDNRELTHTGTRYASWRSNHLGKQGETGTRCRHRKRKYCRYYY